MTAQHLPPLLLQVCSRGCNAPPQDWYLLIEVRTGSTQLQHQKKKTLWLGVLCSQSFLLEGYCVEVVDDITDIIKRTADKNGWKPFSLPRSGYAVQVQLPVSAPGRPTCPHVVEASST